MTTRYRRLTAVVFSCAVICPLLSCSRGPAPVSSTQAANTFASPEEAVKALATAAASGDASKIVAFFGPEGQALLDSSDPATARNNLQVFTVAMGEGWKLVDEGAAKTLVIGNEEWPFPVPLVKEAAGWRFDTAAGKEQILDRRIGRNELAAITAAHGYVAAQRRYAQRAHDGKRAGLFARVFRSDPGKQNGLYWATKPQEPRSPLGDLVADAETHAQQKATGKPAPFHGYYFRILTAQGPAAPGGAGDYLTNGDLARGFALVAWPAEYGTTGIMTFIVNQEGVVREKDLGDQTATVAQQMTTYDPDTSWQPAEDK
jgi:hypothetical protein